MVFLIFTSEGNILYKSFSHTHTHIDTHIYGDTILNDQTKTNIVLSFVDILMAQYQKKDNYHKKKSLFKMFRFEEDAKNPDDNIISQ